MRIQRWIAAAALAALAMAAIAEGREGVAPKPPEGRTPSTIDYAQPAKYARIPKSAGDAKLIKRLAAKLESKDARQTLRNIHGFIADAVPSVPEATWRAKPRNFDALVKGFDHNGCASHALLFANLARACGIPAVYVKSSRHTWIRTFVATGQTGSFSGHVFLEVFIDKTWRLLDAQGMRIWDTYDRTDPELPGGLLAYEKGWDHFAMVHSTRRDEFKAEAVARWRGFDVTKLRRNENVGTELLPPVFAITSGGEWKMLSQRVRGFKLGFDNYHWPKTIARVKGNLLVVTSCGGRLEMPEKERAGWLPGTQAEIQKAAREGVNLVRERRRADGTLVVLLAAPGWDELMALIWNTDFQALRAKTMDRPR